MSLFTMSNGWMKDGDNYVQTAFLIPKKIPIFPFASETEFMHLKDTQAYTHKRNFTARMLSRACQKKN